MKNGNGLEFSLHDSHDLTTAVRFKMENNGSSESNDGGVSAALSVVNSLPI